MGSDDIVIEHLGIGFRTSNRGVCIFAACDPPSTHAKAAKDDIYGGVEDPSSAMIMRRVTSKAQHMVYH